MRNVMRKLSAVAIVLVPLLFLSLPVGADEYGYRLCLDNNKGAIGVLEAERYCESLRRGPEPADPSPGSAEEERRYKLCVAENERIMSIMLSDSYCNRLREEARRRRELGVR